ncbi:MAG TPA: helix-hairpin-helix domain-containing protein, partial [Longimicrobiales bacterium]
MTRGVENLEIAKLLDELADLLEIQGANPFRVRAYRNAAETVKASSRSLADLVEEGTDLTALQGVGKDLAHQLEGLIRTGTLERLEEVSREVPRSLATLTRLEGVGPKKARKLWDELGVTDLDELEEAAEAGRLEGIDGFGKKSQEKILRAITDLRQVTGRFKISEVERLTSGLVDHVREAPGVERLERVGSFRRRRETVGDVDLLVQLAPGGDG